MFVSASGRARPGAGDWRVSRASTEPRSWGRRSPGRGPLMRVRGAGSARTVRSRADKSARDNLESTSAAELGTIVLAGPAAHDSTTAARQQERESRSVLALPAPGYTNARAYTRYRYTRSDREPR